MAEDRKKEEDNQTDLNRPDNIFGTTFIRTKFLKMDARCQAHFKIITPLQDIGVNWCFWFTKSGIPKIINR